ncbi:resolvase [Sphingobium lactosutens DS20]|uniref:Resolvase n=2 Tax=Sphingobium TaxID=165695 RepID=T0HWI1_9SPHN|nr:resolvase [Sphingobium lactosutens DS20]
MHNDRMIYGYARVSSNGQDLTQQVAQLLAAGCVKVYQEKASAASAERPKLKRAIGALDAGDVLMVTATDRLARNTRDLLNILHAVKEAGAGFRSIAEPMVDTTSQFADVIIAVLGIVASWERQRIVERTAAGRDQAKARGVKFGRRAALTPHQQAEALQRLARGDTQRTVAALLGVDQATISRLSRKQG